VELQVSSLSQTDFENLQADLTGLKGSLLMGVLVGAGSIVLNFSNRATVLIQCPFEAYDGKVSSSGHGESPETSVILFRYLNKSVTDTNADRLGRATLVFNAGTGMRITPDDSGFESYVLSTSKGVFPVY
jgi:hypothetical protein